MLGPRREYSSFEILNLFTFLLARHPQRLIPHVSQRVYLLLG